MKKFPNILNVSQIQIGARSDTFQSSLSYFHHKNQQIKNTTINIMNEFLKGRAGRSRDELMDHACAVEKACGAEMVVDGNEICEGR